MRCIMCEELSFTHICPSCQKLFLTPKIYKRQLSDGIEVISFYKYEEIKNLLHTKHTDLGFHIYHILAKNSFELFASEFIFEEKLLSIAIDDNVKGDYSHTAILNHHLKSTSIKPLYSKLRAQNSISYSGKSKRYRETNPRNFRCKNFKGGSLILVDDIVTTGATLNEAIATLKSRGKEVLFCLTLCDVSNS